MDYYELNITISPNNEINRDVIASLLAGTGFESFEETAGGLKAYVAENQYDSTVVEETLQYFPLENVRIDYVANFIKSQNWNEEWEKNFFQPIVIDDQCVVHSSFHTNLPLAKYSIVIDPKMAFGTGHHETTALMLSLLLQTDVEQKSFLDMGCGTAVLAILARMKGANPVVAIDIDEWAYNNSLENICLNNTPGIEVRLGGAEKLSVTEKFDVIFANINRNILIRDIPIYAASMNCGAKLCISGFYKDDIPALLPICESNQLVVVQTVEKNNWVAVELKKER